MKRVAIIAQKGGVGKSTVAVNLAVAAGEGTALFDLDQQESAAIWADRRKAESPHVEFVTERRLPEALRAAEEQGFRLAILDTPPAAGPQAYTAAQTAHLVLIPCRPSLIDLDAIRRTAQLVKSAPSSRLPGFKPHPLFCANAALTVQRGRSVRALRNSSHTAKQRRKSCA